MPANSKKQLKQHEEELKEKVYKEFDDMTRNASSDVDSDTRTVNDGHYEDQDSFIAYGQLSSSRKNMHEVSRLVNGLYKKPYFAHILVENQNRNNEQNYFLSDCESLDQALNIGYMGTEGMLIPFKQDKDRPISKALFHSYQSKKGKPISYKAPKGEMIIIPKLICDADIENRVLLNVNQLYPSPDYSEITADEMLENRLNENRDNPTLQNIISTLQYQQFEIISDDISQSFVVQGCAGSGKSQCLLHRLFYLRDELEQDGWDRVLLITPTQLFRQYSSTLMRRYQLSDVYNCSIADLYRQLLEEYDSRFKDRQYVYQMTEEYLPDAYLKSVYDNVNVQKIEFEIDTAIHQYVSNGCKALGRTLPEIINIDFVDEIINELDKEILAFDAREQELQKNTNYSKKREEYNELLKKSESLQKKQIRFHELIEKNSNRIKEITHLADEVVKCEKEKDDFVLTRNTRIRNAIDELEKASRKVERGTDLQAPAKYARQLYIVRDYTEGDSFKRDEDEFSILNELIEIAKTELAEVIGNKKASIEINRLNKRKKELEDSLGKVSEEIESISKEIYECSEWLRNEASNYEGEEANITLVKSEMQQARYFLTRIESTVFEQEVWNSLAPIKKKYNIKTLEIEELPEGKHRESRILYKSDLLFYVKIYMKLYPNATLSDYGLICIDEGQDLHSADYDILHEIFPESVYNVFGDVDQVLHDTCGISDWKEETGINTIYSLETNYRNTASIVDFCNKKFGIKMNYIGDVDIEKTPIVIHDISTAKDILLHENLVLIVKDRDIYKELCNEVGISQDEFVFLDTLSEKKSNDNKECYSIFAAKGLEFTNVFVCAKKMTKNQKVVACTRAMGGLYYYE